MPNISEMLQKIATAIYGKDMRNSIHDSIEAVNDAVDNVTSDVSDHKAAAVLDHPDGSVTTAKIANSSITTEKIANDAVTKNKIEDEAVSTEKLGFGAVTDERLADSAVNVIKRGVNVYDADISKVGSGNNILYITIDGITDYAQLTGKTIAVDTKAYQCTWETPQAIYLNVNGLGAKNIYKSLPCNYADYDTRRDETGLFTQYEMGRNNILLLTYNGSSFRLSNPPVPPKATKAITASTNDDGSYVTPKKVADYATGRTENISGSRITDGSITTNKLSGGAVTTERIANKSVTTDKLADKSVTTAKLADKAVTGAKIETKTITNWNLSDNAVQTYAIENGAVTSAKLADSAVTAAKIQNGAITAEKLDNNVKQIIYDLEEAVSEADESTAKINGSFTYSEDFSINVSTGNWAVGLNVPSITITDKFFGSFTLPAVTAMDFADVINDGRCYLKYTFLADELSGTLTAQNVTCSGVLKEFKGKPNSYLEIEDGCVVAALYIYVGSVSVSYLMNNDDEKEYYGSFTLSDMISEQPNIPLLRACYRTTGITPTVDANGNLTL